MKALGVTEDLTPLESWVRLEPAKYHTPDTPTY